MTIPNNNPPMSVTGTVTPNTTCLPVGNGGVAVTGVPGGVLNYTWSNGSNSPVLNNLLPGTYSVTVSAGGTCTETASYTVPNNSELPVLLTGSTPSYCGLPNGAVDLEASGGAQPLSYSWSNGMTTQDLPAVPAGTYGVIVTSAQGCISVASAVVPNNDQALP